MPTALWSIPQPDYSSEQIAQLRERLDQRLNDIRQQQGRIVQMSSLSAEDMVITESLVRQALEIKLVMIDTGMLNLETQALAKTLQNYFRRYLRVYYPEFHHLNRFISEHGRLAMYESLELRLRCCELRKVEPLARALQGASAWVTGRRAGQSAERESLGLQENDDVHGLLKFNPLYDFSEDDVWALVHAGGLPINPLYERGYPSIGCAPCSKSVRAGEDIRAGRWWWETAGKKECGLHRVQEDKS